MEVCVNFAKLRCSSAFPDGSLVRDVLTRFVQLQGASPADFYVITNGRVTDLDDPVQHGAVYHLQPRLCGGKGGFGSMLRALGAQIEKTTNREACRDLSGRRLRDVNHEKEMADWLKKQAEREAEKEQRRVERLQRKLLEPKHQFTDAQYQQQCHDLSERLEDAVLKGLQASSSGQVKVDDVCAAKRPNPDQSKQQVKKKKKKMEATSCYWTGLDELSSEDSDEEDESPSTSSRCGMVAMTTRRDKVEPEESSRSSPAESRSEDQDPSPTESRSIEDQNLNLAESRSPEDQDQNSNPAESRSPEDQNSNPAESRSIEDQNLNLAESRSPEDQDQNSNPAESRSHEDQNSNPAESRSHEDQNSNPAESRSPEDQNSNPAESRSLEDQNSNPVESRSHEDRDPNPEESRSTEDQDQKPAESRAECQQQSEPDLDTPLVSVDTAESVQQLESLGLDVLKKELMSRGLKCGGTLRERAARLFSVRGLRPDQIDPVLLAKPGKSMRK